MRRLHLPRMQRLLLASHLLLLRLPLADQHRHPLLVIRHCHLLQIRRLLQIRHLLRAHHLLHHLLRAHHLRHLLRVRLLRQRVIRNHPIKEALRAKVSSFAPYSVHLTD